MKTINFMAALIVTLALGACATTGQLQPVRTLAAESGKLNDYPELSMRFRDTYQREKPYLSKLAEQRELLIDARRRAAFDDFINIHKSVVLYLHTLGELAGDQHYNLRNQINSVGSGISAWPDSGIDQHHVDAYTRLGNLIARTLASSAQNKAVRAMIKEGDPDFQSLVDAMIAVLNYYKKTSINERKIVLGLFEVEMPFIDSGTGKLLIALAKVHYQTKMAEYEVIEGRFALLDKNLKEIARDHKNLLQNLQSNGDTEMTMPRKPALTLPIVLVADSD
ncbi:MAG: hypothetical protein ACI83P_000973 [Janthinobacterium sp.]|jgi:hypothetical protein